MWWEKAIDPVGIGDFTAGAFAPPTVGMKTLEFSNECKKR